MLAFPSATSRPTWKAVTSLSSPRCRHGRRQIVGWLLPAGWAVPRADHHEEQAAHGQGGWLWHCDEFVGPAAEGDQAADANF